MNKKRVLTGIKPTGLPHIGNYLGAIKPALAFKADYERLFFIADYHALTTNKESLKELTHEVAATWLALGLDPDRCIVYKQSDVSEIFELNWILSCFASKGLLNRAHAYKASVDENISKGKDPDHNINHGLYSYPVLMAADILLFDTTIVPVGADQKQHVEIARDIAEAFNKVHENALILPDLHIEKNAPVITGTDGRKMSKNYNNTVPIFLEEKKLRKTVMKIVSDSKGLEDVKDPKSCQIFQLYSHFASDQEIEAMKAKYLAGNYGYGHAKQALYDCLLDYFKEARTIYQQLMSDTDKIDAILDQGAQKARVIAKKKLDQIKAAINL